MKQKLAQIPLIQKKTLLEKTRVNTSLYGLIKSTSQPCENSFHIEYSSMDGFISAAVFVFCHNWFKGLRQRGLVNSKPLKKVIHLHFLQETRNITT